MAYLEQETRTFTPPMSESFVPPMRDLNDTPFLNTASPFATKPTIIETNLPKVQESVISGFSVAVGFTLGGLILYMMGIKKVL